MEQATPQKDRFLVESQTGVFSKKGLQVLNMEVGTRWMAGWSLENARCVKLSEFVCNLKMWIYDKFDSIFQT